MICDTDVDLHFDLTGVKLGKMGGGGLSSFLGHTIDKEA